jgi:hypothetical protein
MSDLKKIKISDLDIYKLYCLQNADNNLSGLALMKKQKIHQKKVEIIKNYTSNFVQLGGSINEIKRDFSAEKMDQMKKEFGDFSIEEMTASKYTKGQIKAIIFLTVLGIAIGAIVGLGIIYWKEILGTCIVVFFILGALFSPGKKEEILFDKKGKQVYKKTTEANGNEKFTKLD